MIYNQYHANLKYEIWKCTLKKKEKTCRLLGLTPRTKKTPDPWKQASLGYDHKN